MVTGKSFFTQAFWYSSLKLFCQRLHTTTFLHCLPLTFSTPQHSFRTCFLNEGCPSITLMLACLFLLPVASPSPKRSIRMNFLKFLLGPKHFPKFRPFNDSPPSAGSNFLCIQDSSRSGTCLYLSVTHLAHSASSQPQQEFLPTPLHLCLDYHA